MKQKMNILGAFIRWAVIGFVSVTGAAPCFSAEQFPTIVEAAERAVLSAEWEGALTNFTADVGSHVKKGAPLAIVFHKDLILNKKKLESMRKYLKIQVENLGKLHEKGMVADEELEKARMELAVKDAEIALTNTQIDRARIRSPFSGVIVARHIQPYEWVRAGQPVVELYDPLRLRIVADIPSELSVHLKKGQKHVFFFSDLQKELNAKLSAVYPQVDVRSNTVKIYWEVAPETIREVRLVPGMKGVLKLGSQE